MSNPIPVPRPVPLSNRNQPPQKQNNAILIGIAAAIGILILILLFAMLRGCGGGAGDSGSGDGGGIQGTSGRDGSSNSYSSGSNGTSSSENQGTAGGKMQDEHKPEQKAGSESTEKTAMNSSDSEHPAAEQGNTGEKQTQDKEEEKKSETNKETKAEDKPKDDLPQHSLAAKLSGEAADKDEPAEEKEETKQGGGFLGKGDADVSFFGAKGKGSKFVYVIDHSGSMSGSPLEEAKKEMLKGLDLLKPHHKFNVIFYDHQFISWTDGKLFPATDKNKKEAERFINAVQAAGGTEPEPALVKAVQGKPEHIFFLTDGEFSMNWEQMCEFANKNKVHINVIQFGSSSTPKSPLLQELAKRTKGDYRFIDVGALDSL